MRIRRILLFSLALAPLLFPCKRAQAEGRAILMLGEFNQWVDLVYNFDNQLITNKTTSSRTQHYFKEEYHFSTAYAIMNPRILRGKFTAGFGFDQNIYEASRNATQFSSGTNFQYSLTGALLERSPYPVHFFSQSEYLHAQREFSTSYDINVDRNGVVGLLKNRLLPVRFEYTRTTSETSGLGSDRLQTSDTVAFNVAHRIGQFSETDAQVSVFRTNSRLKSGGPESENKTSELSLRNQLHLSRRVPGRLLSSSLQVREEVTTDMPDTRTLIVEEQLIWPMGKALTTGGSFLMSNRENSRGTDSHKAGRVWLQHRLFDSLSTQISADYIKDNLISGKEENLGGTFDVTYLKRLPADSHLQLNFYQQYMVTDRSLTGSAVTVVDEPHSAAADPVVPGLVSSIPLRHTDIIPETVVVRNADPRTRLLPYTQGVDYTVQQSGMLWQIVILPGSEIIAGDNLLITYSYQANPQIKYGTNSRRVGFNLMLFKNAYQISGGWYESDQEYISGRADSVRLIDQKWYKLRVEANRVNLNYGIEYENYQSDLDRHQTILGFIRYTRIFGRSSLSLYSSDAYTITKPLNLTGFDLPERKVTTISAGATYTTVLFSNAQLVANAKYVNLRGDTLSRDDIAFGLNLRWNYGKIALSLLSQINWRIIPGITTEEEYIRLHVTRYF